MMRLFFAHFFAKGVRRLFAGLVFLSFAALLPAQTEPASAAPAQTQTVTLSGASTPANASASTTSTASTPEPWRLNIGMEGGSKPGTKTSSLGGDHPITTGSAATGSVAAARDN